MQENLPLQAFPIDFRRETQGAAATPTTQLGIFPVTGYRFLSIISPFPINCENEINKNTGRCIVQFESSWFAVREQVLNYPIPTGSKFMRWFNKRDAFDNRLPRGGSGPGTIVLSNSPLPYSALPQPANLRIPVDFLLPANPGGLPVVTTTHFAWGFETDTGLAVANYLTGYAPYRQVSLWYYEGIGNRLAVSWEAGYKGGVGQLIYKVDPRCQSQYSNLAVGHNNHIDNPLAQASGCGWVECVDTAPALAPGESTRLYFMFSDR